MRSLVYADLNYETLTGESRCWVPLGRFCWKAHRPFGEPVMKQVAAALENDGADWPPLKAGMLRGSVSRAQEVMDAVQKFVGTLPMG